MQPVAPPSGEVYYGDRYWNELPAVQRYLNEAATGDAGVQWWQHLPGWHGGPFSRALAINCGIGWVERMLVDHGVILNAVGVDVTPDLLARAREAAAAHPIDYVEADINAWDFQLEQPVDLVVNHAAAHHIAFIDRTFRHLARLLGPDGVFVSYDYIGAHRNCYPVAHWQAMHEANEALAPEFRQRLRHPHVATMLVTDPSEAVHSELIMTTMRRYFDIRYERYLGGAVAYELLNRNQPFHDPDVDSAAALAQVIEADRAYRDLDPERNSLFAYVVATPKADLPSQDQLDAWTAEEEAREAAAVAAGGRYYTPSVVEAVYDQLYDAEDRIAALTARAEAAENAPPPPIRSIVKARARAALGRAQRELRARRSR